MKIKVNGKILIFCGKCHEEIPCGEEIIIKDKVVFCKECFQKISVVCHDCCLPIFKHELIHEVSVGWSIDSENRSVNLVQCYLCHKEWLRETKKLKRLRRWQVLIFENHVFFTTSLLTLWLTFMAVILGIGGLEGIDALTPKVWRYFILWSIVMITFRIFFFMLFEFAITRILKKNKEEKGAKRELWELIRIKKKLKERAERLRKNSKKSAN